MGINPVHHTEAFPVAKSNNTKRFAYLKKITQRDRFEPSEQTRPFSSPKEKTMERFEKGTLIDVFI